MKKGWIIAIVILLAYLILMIVLFEDKNDNNKQTKQEKQTIEKYFEPEKDSIKKEVEPNNTGIDMVKQELQIIGVSGYDSFTPATYNIQNLSTNNLSYFKKYVKDENDLKNLSINQKVEFDFDSDGDLEQLLLISNVDDENAQKWISAVYYIDEKINKIKLVKYSMYEQSNIKFELANIADLNDNGKYEILLKLLPSNGDCYDLYTLGENTYKPVVICDQPTV